MTNRMYGGSRFSLKKRIVDKRSDRAHLEKQSTDSSGEWISYISEAEAACLEEDLQTEFGFTALQLIEQDGLACATAIAKAYPQECLTKGRGAILVVCGPGSTGSVGLVCARYLKSFDYRPTVYYRKRQAGSTTTSLTTTHLTLLQQCERMHLPFLSYLPSDAKLLTSSYNLIIDGFMGPNSEKPVTEDSSVVIRTMVKSGLPVISIDIPSGWDSDGGGEDSNDLQPEMLISLSVPKLPVRSFRGRTHYLIGRFLPVDLLRKYDLQLPVFPGSALCLELSPGPLERLRPQLSTDNSIDFSE